MVSAIAVVHKGLIATDMSDADIYKLGTILREENVSITMKTTRWPIRLSSLDTNSALTEDELNHLKNGAPRLTWRKFKWTLPEKP